MTETDDHPPRCDDPEFGGVMGPDTHDYGKWGPWKVAPNAGLWEYRRRTCSRCGQAAEESRARKNPPMSVKRLEAEIAARNNADA